MGDLKRPASADDEEFARANFDTALPYDEWAARNLHNFALFNFDDREYADPELNRWLEGLAEWLFADGLQQRLRAAREKYLTHEQIAEYEAIENDPF